MRLQITRGFSCAVTALCLLATARGQSAPTAPKASTSAPAPAASQAAPTQLSPAVLAGEPYYIKSTSTVVNMNADGTGTRLITNEIVVQSEASVRDLSVLTLLLSSQSERADFVYARVVHPDGTTQETPADSAIEQPAPITQQAPFYSDIQTKQLPVKGLRIGDTLQWQARFTVYHAEAPGQFWGQDTFATDAVVLNESYELRVPAGLHVTVWTNPRAGAITSEADEAGQHIYRWRHAALDPTVGPAAEARKKAEDHRILTADEELDATQGKLPSFAFTTFPDWAAVGAWYRTLVADRIAPDDAIRAKVAELTAGKSSDLEKAQAVYTFVSTRIRYIGVDFGVGRYQPHTAAEVFANQYGDCKDKHILLASMLSVINVHADPVLIGLNIRFNAAVPAPQSFNHAITRLSLNGQDVWLDSTEETGVWAALIKTIRDQDALVIPPSGPAVVAHTPAELPFPQTNTLSADGKLDKDLTSDSKFTFVLHDDNELIIRSVLHSVSPAQYDIFVQRLMSGLGFGGTTSDPEIDNLDDPSKPLQISFHYHRIKEKDWGEDRITAAFQPVSLPAFTADDPATSTIQIGSPRTETSTVRMQLPEGWLASLPTATHAHAAFANCDVTYSISDHVLTAERRLVILQSKVPLKDAKQYQSWYDDCGADGTPFIQLFPAAKVTAAGAGSTANQPEPKAPDATAATVKPSDPKAAELVQQAAESARAMDIDNARKLLDQAAAINPTQINLWLMYGAVDDMLGVRSKALEDYQRELTYHPEEVKIYPAVAQLQLAFGDSDAALATLRAWVKNAPGSIDAALALARRLMELKSYKDALDEARIALDTLAATGIDLTDLKIVAANAEVALGRAADAANSVAPLLKTATTPGQINDIAYILAEGNVDLDEAFAAESKVIADAEADTASWSITEDLKPMFQKQSDLAAAWDTLAWILYRQGKTAEALGYLTAALHSQDIQDVRDHLTAVNARVHSVAAAAMLKSNEQDLRTFNVGPAIGHDWGDAPFTLLIVDGKISDSALDKSYANGTGKDIHDPTLYLKKADLHALFPPGSKAHLIRSGFVNCHSGGCQLVLAPIASTGRVRVVQAPPSANKADAPTARKPAPAVVKNLPLSH